MNTEEIRDEVEGIIKQDKTDFLNYVLCLILFVSLFFLNEYRKELGMTLLFFISLIFNNWLTAKKIKTYLDKYKLPGDLSDNRDFNEKEYKQAFPAASRILIMTFFGAAVLLIAQQEKYSWALYLGTVLLGGIVSGISFYLRVKI